MKSFILLICVFITVPAFAKYQCVNVYRPGYVYINGRLQTVVHFDGPTITLGCTVRSPGYIYWKFTGLVCVGNIIYGRNYDGIPFSCRVTKVG